MLEPSLLNTAWGPHWEDGWVLWRQGDLRAAHEAFEAVWVACGRGGPEAELSKALAQWTAAAIQVGRGRLEGAQTILRRVVNRLSALPPTVAGIPMAPLLHGARTALARLETASVA